MLARSGQPPLATRPIAGLMILKALHGLSDEALCARWIENPYLQHFCSEAVFRRELPFDRCPLNRWRQRLGEEQLVAAAGEPGWSPARPARSRPETSSATPSTRRRGRRPSLIRPAHA